MAEKGANTPIWLGWVGLGWAGLGRAGLAVLSSPGLSGSYQLWNFPLVKPLTSEGTRLSLISPYIY